MEDSPTAQAELETSSTHAEGFLAADAKYSSSVVESSCNNDDPDPLASGCNPHRNIFDVPPELLIIIFQAFLPAIVSPKSLWQDGICERYLKSRSLLRLVSRTWRDLLDDTPSFWIVLSSTVPRTVNQTSITRSGEAPVIVYFGRSPTVTIFDRGDSDEYPDGFTELVGLIRDRWKVVWVEQLAAPVVWEYLKSPAPMIDAVHMRVADVFAPGCLELLGGETHNIRYIDLHSLRIPWSRSKFCGLKHLGLSYAADDVDGLTMDVILDVLANSPELEYLKIDSTAIPVSNARFSHPICLPHLRTIELAGLPGHRLFPFLHHIEAPQCQIISIRAEHVSGTDGWLDESMGSFEPLLRKLHKQSGGSKVTVSPGFVNWTTHIEPSSGEHNYPSIQIRIRILSFAALLRWVERVVDGADMGGLEVDVRIWGENALQDPEVKSVLRRLRSVTSIYVYAGGGNSCETVRLLCNLEDNPVPVLPSLRLLYIIYEDLTPEEILLMLQNRFNAPFYDEDAHTLRHLEVKAELPAGDEPVPISSVDFATITKIRSIGGASFRLIPAWDSIGTSAIVWDDEEGVPKWM